MRFVQKLFERIFAIAGALVFIELPRFMYSYHLILKGHLSELSLQIQNLEQLSLLSRQNFKEFINKFLQNSDQDFQAIGFHMLSLIDKESFYKVSLKNFEMASFITKPFVFIKNLDLLIFKETIASYTPAIIISLESIIYAIAGAFLGYVLAKIMVVGVKKVFQKRLNQEEIIKPS